MLSENQINWIFERCRQLTCKYASKFPLSDDEWSELLQEQKHLEEISRREDLMKELLVAIGKYFMNEEKKGK